MEKKYQEQLKYLQDEIQNEREVVNMQTSRLRSDCEQQVQHMQQINIKCKEYCSQLEQVGCHFFFCCNCLLELLNRFLMVFD